MKRLAVSIVLVFIFLTHASAALVRELNIEQLCSQSHNIFAGVCTAAGTEGRDVLFFTFTVLQILKGEQRDTITIRMHKKAATLAGAPTFRVGEEVVLFLYPESAKGFTSPVGFGQGKFFITRSPAGDQRVLNGHNNSSLFKNMALSTAAYLKHTPGASIQECTAAQGGSIRYQEFIALLEAMLHNDR
jgi:hypothetical protein